jgi:hypothetical protein
LALALGKKSDRRASAVAQAGRRGARPGSKVTEDNRRSRARIRRLEVDERQENPLISGNTELEIVQRCRAARAGKRCLITFVAFSGDNATDEKRPAAMPDGQSGGMGGRRRE